MINYEVDLMRCQPAYDLKSVKQLVRRGEFMLFSRPYHFMLNRYDGENPAEIAASVIEAIREDNFYKSDELKRRPGVFADVYSGIECVDYPEGKWYAKIVMTDGETGLEIWSMNWDGYIH